MGIPPLLGWGEGEIGMMSMRKERKRREGGMGDRPPSSSPPPSFWACSPGPTLFLSVGREGERGK